MGKAVVRITRIIRKTSKVKTRKVEFQVILLSVVCSLLFRASILVGIGFAILANKVYRFSGYASVVGGSETFETRQPTQQCRH